MWDLADCCCGGRTRPAASWPSDGLQSSCPVAGPLQPAVGSTFTVLPASDSCPTASSCCAVGPTLRPLQPTPQRPSRRVCKPPGRGASGPTVAKRARAAPAGQPPAAATPRAPAQPIRSSACWEVWRLIRSTGGQGMGSQGRFGGHIASRACATYARLGSS